MAVRLEASSEIDLPPSTWADIVSAAGNIAGQLFTRGSVALRITGASSIRSLNRMFRGVDEATDVLSFQSEAGSSDYGDIALNWHAVVSQSDSNGNTPLAEAAALIAHGMLHLAGYDHPDDDSQQEMDTKTRELCRLAGIEVTDFGH